jgi:hypothetical protein
MQGVSLFTTCSYDVKFSPPPAPVVWTCRVYHCPLYLLFRRAGCIPFTNTGSMDVQVVSLSTASSLDVQGVSLSPPPTPAVWTYRVYPFPVLAVWTCRMYPCPPPQYGRAGCIPLSTPSSMDYGRLRCIHL